MKPLNQQLNYPSFVEPSDQDLGDLPDHIKAYIDALEDRISRQARIIDLLGEMDVFPDIDVSIRRIASEGHETSPSVSDGIWMGGAPEIVNLGSYSCGPNPDMEAIIFQLEEGDILHRRDSTGQIVEARILLDGTAVPCEDQDPDMSPSIGSGP